MSESFDNHESDELIEDDYNIDEQDDESREAVATLSGWGLSIATHLVVFLALAFVVIAGRLLDEPIPIKTSHVEVRIPTEEPQDDVDIVDVDITIPVDEVVSDPVVDNMEVEVEELETEDEEVSDVSEPNGREEVVASSEAGGAHAFMQIGPASAAAGVFGNRSGGGKRRALSQFDWLVANQKADGSFGKSRNYENGICTMALVEAYAMSLDEELREPAQRGVDYLLKMQSGGDDPYAGGAWDYTHNKGRDDASVSGWAIMALKSAKAAHLEVGNGMEKAQAWFQSTWEAANAQAGLNPSDPYKDISIFPYAKKNGSYQKVTPGVLGKKGARTPIGLCIGVFLGNGSGNIMMESMANEVIKTHLPSYASFDTTNQYWMYYNTLGVFQVGGERWLQFNDVVRDMLIGAQRKEDGCFCGSWDWKVKGNHFHGRETGRLISTAYCVLSLQVYYRYVPIDGKKVDLPPF
jgi:hypothetical protein